MTELVFTPARSLTRMLRSREISAVELARAFIAQIERINPQVNAIVTFLPERALEEAKRLDAGGPGGRPLFGLPIAYKDMIATKGIRTTYGSPIFADNVPAEDAVIVERLRNAGTITLGKTNTPEFAAGSQTFNPVFGATRNPWDLDKTCGGSSGGAAVAVACGMLPFADGSDLGGSLRNPGNFNNVVGLRPTPGRVPVYPTVDAWGTMSVVGPIARTVDDCAFLFSAMAGRDDRSPVSFDDATDFAAPLERDFRGARVAWWPYDHDRLHGEESMPVDARVIEVLQRQRRVFESLGCVVEDAHPDLRGAGEVFHVLRALGFVQRYAGLLAQHRDKIKDTVIWNIEQGLTMDLPRVARAFNLRSQVFERMRQFMQRYDFLCLPVNQVPPFPVSRPYIDEINGVKLASYIDWMKTCSYITATSHPAISVPAGFTRDDPPLPVGLQIVGRYKDDFGVLQMAHAFERETRFTERRAPILQTGPG